MKIVLFALVILAVIVASAQAALDGTWKTEWNTTIDLRVDQAGYLRGQLTVEHSPNDCAHGTFELFGRIAASPMNHGLPLAFTVGWINDLSDCAAVSTWSGQYFPQEQDHPEVIRTTWLRTFTTEHRDSHGATNVGDDVFFRPH